jgi:hypothetical protein
MIRPLADLHGGLRLDYAHFPTLSTISCVIAFDITANITVQAFAGSLASAPWTIRGAIVAGCLLSKTREIALTLCKATPILFFSMGLMGYVANESPARISFGFPP